jgi:hypothetical protein
LKKIEFLFIPETQPSKNSSTLKTLFRITTLSGFAAKNLSTKKEKNKLPMNLFSNAKPVKNKCQKHNFIKSAAYPFTNNKNYTPRRSIAKSLFIRSPLSLKTNKNLYIKCLKLILNLNIPAAKKILILKDVKKIITIINLKPPKCTTDQNLKS